MGVAKAHVWEGTWDEIAKEAVRLPGHRLRVTLLPETSSPLNLLQEHPTGRYAARMNSVLNAPISPATAEEAEDAQRELDEVMCALNENRQREGAEPIF